ncbi:MAG: hypothetical protein NXI32_05060 [bacterium]|nr:hypothetical protein [bacterium]
MTERGYSATVELRLETGTKTFQLAALGPDHARFREPLELRDFCALPQEAEIVVRIDDNERHYPIALEKVYMDYFTYKKTGESRHIPLDNESK